VRQLFLYFTTRYARRNQNFSSVSFERVSNLEKIVAEQIAPSNGYFDASRAAAETNGSAIDANPVISLFFRRMRSGP
jgi:hypothetical protein